MGLGNDRPGDGWKIPAVYPLTGKANMRKYGNMLILIYE
jgi:hypothetical protein